MDSQPRYAMVEKIIGRTGSRGGITHNQDMLWSRRLLEELDQEEELHKYKSVFWMIETESY